MKKTKWFALVLTMALALTACGKAATDSSATSETSAVPAESAKVVATIYPVYSMTEALLPDQVSMLLPPGADMHHYDLTPKDMKTLQNAEVVVYAGDAAEPWVKEIKESLGDKGPRWVDASQGIELLPDGAGNDLLGHREDEVVAEDEHHDEDKDEHHDEAHDKDEHEHHHDHGGMDPHYWTSLRHALTMTDNIAKGLVEALPADKGDIEKAAAAYQSELKDLDKAYSDFFATVKDRPLVVADRFPFRYFAKDYNIPFAALYETCDEEADFSPKRLARLQDFIQNRQDVTTLYYTELTEPKVAMELAKDTGKKTALLNAAHEVNKEDMDKGVTYIDMMKANLEALKAGLSA